MHISNFNYIKTLREVVVNTGFEIFVKKQRAAERVFIKLSGFASFCRNTFLYVGNARKKLSGIVA